jgi:predicted RNase H-like HicB family nuclease
MSGETETVSPPIHIRGNGMKTYVFRVVIEPDEDRYYAEIPALPDCHSWGYTYEEALKNVKEAAELCLETMIEDGEPIPPYVQVSQEPLLGFSI